MKTDLKKNSKDSNGFNVDAAPEGLQGRRIINLQNPENTTAEQALFNYFNTYLEKRLENKFNFHIFT